jgi:hypothetical protein
LIGRAPKSLDRKFRDAVGKPFRISPSAETGAEGYRAMSFEVAEGVEDERGERSGTRPAVRPMIADGGAAAADMRYRPSRRVGQG